MTDAVLASAAKPKHSDNVIIELGTKAYKLAILYQSDVEPRLPQNALPALADDLTSLGVTIPGVKVARAQADAATAGQLVELKHGVKLTRAIHKAVRNAGADRDVRKEYGVGRRINAEVRKDVTASLKLIQDRAKAQPAEATSLGITQKDLDAVDARIKSIDKAFTTKREKRAAAPLTTKERNRTLNRVLKAVGRIAAAGGLEFVGDENKAKLFAALKPPKQQRKPGASKKAAAAEKGTTAEAPKDGAPKEGEQGAPKADEPAAPKAAEPPPAPSPAEPANTTPEPAPADGVPNAA